MISEGWASYICLILTQLSHTCIQAALGCVYCVGSVCTGSIEKHMEAAMCGRVLCCSHVGRISERDKERQTGEEGNRRMREERWEEWKTERACSNCTVTKRSLCIRHKRKIDTVSFCVEFKGQIDVRYERGVKRGQADVWGGGHERWWHLGCD